MDAITASRPSGWESAIGSIAATGSAAAMSVAGAAGWAGVTCVAEDDNSTVGTPSRIVLFSPGGFTENV